MRYALLEIALEPDDLGLLVAVFTWVEVTWGGEAMALRIQAQPWVKYERVSAN